MNPRGLFVKISSHYKCACTLLSNCYSVIHYGHHFGQ